jgi:YfiH family protein
MLELIQPDWSAAPNIKAFTTTRKSGVSGNQWARLNLGRNCGDHVRHVEKNRALLGALLPSDPYWLRQVHGTQVVSLDADFNSEQEADASVCMTPSRVCAILTADCLPVLFCDRAGTKVAAAHAGWRGLANGVLEATVAAMNCKATELMAWLGPAIGPHAFEVGSDVRDAYLDVDMGNEIAFKPHSDRWLADIYSLATLALARVGVKQVSGGQYCTYTDKENFFSYRRDGETGRMATVIWMDK